MKDCKKCFYYYKQIKRCIKFKCDISDTKVFGSVCKNYLELKREKVKCKNCKNLNKYNFCLMKKVCMNDTEKNRDFCETFDAEGYEYKIISDFFFKFFDILKKYKKK